MEMRRVLKRNQHWAPVSQCRASRYSASTTCFSHLRLLFFYIKLVQISWIQLLPSAAPILFLSYYSCTCNAPHSCFSLTDWQLKPQRTIHPLSRIKSEHSHNKTMIHTLTCCCAWAQSLKISFNSQQWGSVLDYWITPHTSMNQNQSLVGTWFLSDLENIFRNVGFCLKFQE